jgi:hypothetical protein
MAFFELSVPLVEDGELEESLLHAAKLKHKAKAAAVHFRKVIFRI